MNIYVGNLTYEATENDVRQLFETFGEVTSVKIITDKYTGQSRGIGFIEMTNKKEALAAISDLNDKELKGRALKVNEAQPKKTHRRAAVVASFLLGGIDGGAYVEIYERALLGG